MKKAGLGPMLFSCIKGYNSKQLVKDIIAGIIVAIIALPLSIALALASGVGPEVGIYTAIVGGFLISFLGGSKVQIAGPTAAFATIVAGIVATDGMAGLIVATIIAGVLLIVMGLCRVGSLIKYIPYTITAGFTAGIAVTIIIGQIKDFIGLSYPAGTPNVETTEKVANIFGNLGSFNALALLVGVICLAVLIFWPKVPKIGQTVPGSLVAVVVGILLVKIFNMPVNTIGDLYTIKAGFPPIAVPQFSWKLITGEFGNGFTIAVLAAIESLLSCVVADGMIDDKHKSNQELIAQGIGNIGCALFGGIPATGAIARTAANIKNGGRTPIAGMVHAVVLVLVLLFLMPYASWIPMPTIAAILFMVAYNMCGLKDIIILCKRAPKSDLIILFVTMILTIVFDLVIAIEVGMVAACVLFIKRMAEETKVRKWKTASELDPSDPSQAKLRQIPDYVSVYEVTGPLFFGAAEKVNELRFSEKTKVLVLRMRGVPAIDATTMKFMENLKTHCDEVGATLIFSHVNEQPFKMMEKGGFVERTGRENFCKDINAALERALELRPE